MKVGAADKYGYSRSDASSLTVLRSRDADSSNSSILGINSSAPASDTGRRLLSASAQSNHLRTIDKLKSGLTELRKTLQTTRDQKLRDFAIFPQPPRASRHPPLKKQ
jgi:hypothetical protein